MRIRKIIMIVLAISLLAALGVSADDTEVKVEKTKKETLGQAKSMIAEISVPKLTKDHVKKYATVLKEVEGIQSIKPDMEASSMLITYDSKLKFKEKVMPLLKTVDEKTEITGIVESKTAPTSKCGGCPHQSKCSKSTKETTKAKSATSCSDK